MAKSRAKQKAPAATPAATDAANEAQITPDPAAIAAAAGGGEEETPHQLPNGDTILLGPAIDPDTLTEEDKANVVDGEWVAEKISPYLDAYPDEKEFHITSDGSVFLGKDKSFAKEHQAFLKDGKEVISFTVE